MDLQLPKIVEHLIGRLTGPLRLRLFFQPAMAIAFGIRDGMRDAKENKPAYLWAVFTNPARRLQLLKGALRAVAKILIVAVVLDAVYQVIELHWFYPGQALLVGLILAFVPYLIIRGPVNRIAGRWMSRPQSEQEGGTFR